MRLNLGSTNTEVRSGRVLVCDLVMLELVRLAPNEERARELSTRLASFDTLSMPQSLWSRAREVQLSMAASGDHRRVPPSDLRLESTSAETVVGLRAGGC
jgi:hypothetical protein